MRLHTTIDLAPVTNLSSRRWAEGPDGGTGSAEGVAGHHTDGAAWPEAGVDVEQASPSGTESTGWR